MVRALEEDAASNGARVLGQLHYPLFDVDLHALVCWLSAKPTQILNAMHASLGAWYAL